MFDSLNTYKTWAPENSAWTQWAKPVLFIHEAQVSFKPMDIPELEWIQSMDRQTMIIVDLPGESGVIESLGLARLGYRPVPLYNGVDGRAPSMIVQVSDIATALFKGVDQLMSFHVRAEAPPAFMLDSNRMRGGGKMPGTYDNRWCVFPQDMPSAAFLAKEGIRKIIVRSAAIQNDLSHILHRYQDAGIEIYLCTGKEAEKIPVVKPSKYKSLSYRFMTILGLTRNGAGGFGSVIPEATQSSSGSRYHGFG
jgi:hypothetical protein